MKEKAKGVLRWITGTITTAIDDAKEDRIAGYVSKVVAEVGLQRKKFHFASVAAALGIPDADAPAVADRVYRRFLDRAWADAQLTSREVELLRWLAGALGLGAEEIAGLNADAAGGVFSATLAKVTADGQVDENEAARLQAIAAHAGLSVGDMMDRFCKKEGDALLRSIFSQAASDGRLDRREWAAFRETAARLGIPSDQVLRAIRLPAHQLVEHVLADARSDGEISEREERVLLALLATIIDDKPFDRYVRQEIQEAKEMQRLAKGLLPSLPAPPGIALRAGEIVHWVGPVEYVQTRELASGTRIIEIDGAAVITDTRMILNAADKSLDVNHRRVLAHFVFGDEIEIRAANRGAGRYTFPEDGEKAVVIWQVAIGRANQTIVAADDAQARRRISRDVRQRVWQRYGGRCAECGSDTYLEFDHIIPVAKGGGNSDTNVQLLCRNCNLAKSDSI